MEKTISFESCEERFIIKEEKQSLNKSSINKIDNKHCLSTNPTKDSHINKEEFEKSLSKEKINYSNSNYEMKQKDTTKNDEFLMNLRKNNNCKFYENFEIQEYLGKGRESKVYKGYEKRSKRVFALKIIFKRKDENINNELKLLKKSRNKNVINYFGSYEIKKDEYACIIMNLGKFGNLINFQDNVINKNYLSESILCFIGYQILCGLQYLHKCKVCHFDIKPQNIIIEDSLNVQIIDYSLSEDYSTIESPLIKLPFRGTSFFMAPEIIRTDIINIKDIAKVDLFSFGVVLYYFAFGYFPFNLKKEDIKNNEIIYQKITQDLIIDNENNYYSAYFIDFLNRLLEKDINKRINIKEALNHYWIKGAEILFDEKEKLFNTSTFLKYLDTGHFKDFNDYIKKNYLIF